MDQINILVTDDEREIADLLEIYLVSDGYRVWKNLIDFDSSEANPSSVVSIA